MPIRVAIVDDSPFTCGLLAEYLADVPGLKVIGSAHSGEAAIELVKTQQPDVLTLDVELPDADGVSVLRRLMSESPLPVVMVSGLSRRAAEITHTAISEGAVDFILKYSATSNLDTDLFQRDFATRIRQAGRRGARFHRASPPVIPAIPGTLKTCPTSATSPVIVIGCSTGGPSALQQLFAEWPGDLNAAVLIVQHMPAGFTKTLALQLDRLGSIPVREAQPGDRLTTGTALVAPGDFHLVINEQRHVELTQAEKVSGHRPSIDVTMQSVARVFGSRAIGVILTGMGNDGADGLTAIADAAGTTVAQDGSTCVVNGMPQRAIDRGIVQFIGSPRAIARHLQRLATPNLVTRSVNEGERSKPRRAVVGEAAALAYASGYE